MVHVVVYLAAYTYVWILTFSIGEQVQGEDDAAVGAILEWYNGASNVAGLDGVEETYLLSVPSPANWQMREAVRERLDGIA